MAAQLVWMFKAQGVNIHYRYARALIAECPLAVRKRYIRFSDAWTWWVLHPDFHPFAEKDEKSDMTCNLSHSLAPPRT